MAFDLYGKFQTAAVTCNEIYDLVDTLPTDVPLQGELVNVRHIRGGEEKNPLQRRMLQIDRYAIAYHDLQFPWHYLQLLLAHNLEFTSPAIHYADRAMRDAWRWIHDYDDPEMTDAVALAKSAPFSDERRKVEALLCSHDYTLDEVTRALGVSARVIALYEKLFFNIIDRRREALYIGQIIWPHTRLTEMLENYLAGGNAGLGLLLRRVGYENGMQHVLHYAGLQRGEGLIAALPAKDLPQQLEALIMANGYLLAKNGLGLNQRHNAVGVSNARGLISAAKASGMIDEAAGADSPLRARNVGQSIWQELLALKGDEARAAALRHTKTKAAA